MRRNGGTAKPAEPGASAADRARADILEVATAEFAEHGYAGARVDEIAAKTQTSKRMIYCNRYEGPTSHAASC